MFDVMEELKLFPEELGQSLDVLLVAFDEESHHYAFGCLNRLRAAGLNAELYPKPTKLNKQMKYANARKVPYTVLIGSDEMESGKLTLKNMTTGEQTSLQLDAIISQLQG